MSPDAARGHHEGTKRQHVDADHPLQIRGVAAEVGRHPRQRQVHREVADLHAEQRRRHRRQDSCGSRGAARRSHGPTIRPATADTAGRQILDLPVTRETYVTITHSDNLFVLVGLGVLCFVEQVRRHVRSLWQEVLWSG
jgi:hypothetical protein